MVHVVKPVDIQEADDCQNGNNKRQLGAISDNCWVLIEIADLTDPQKVGGQLLPSQRRSFMMPISGLALGCFSIKLA
jgi:hypothetical protein